MVIVISGRRLRVSALIEGQVSVGTGGDWITTPYAGSHTLLIRPTDGTIRLGGAAVGAAAGVQVRQTDPPVMVELKPNQRVRVAAETGTVAVSWTLIPD